MIRKYSRIDTGYLYKKLKKVTSVSILLNNGVFYTKRISALRIMFKVFLETFGCQMNVADSDMLADLLAERGYRQTDSAGDADLIIVNTCSVRERAENRAKVRITQYARMKKPSQQLWVVGCMAQRLGDTLQQEIPGIDRVIGAEKLEYIANDIDTLLAERIGTEAYPDAPGRGIAAFLSIMRGCDNYCAYCIVPYVRGREHSIPAGRLKKQAEEMVAHGTREITLLGQNVNSYRDDSRDFADLIHILHDIDGLKRLRFTTSHPRDLSDKLIRTMAELPGVCNHIHLPVQSGSTRILTKMNRKYTREHYLERIELLRQQIPDVDITTDVMVGFPGETENDYRHTLSLFEQVRFTAAFMFSYSVRPGTKAAAMDNQVPEKVRKERLKGLVDLQTEITRDAYRAMVGRTAEVLFTGRQDRKDRAWMGQDYGCKRILLSCREDIAGMILKVNIIKSTGMTLIAERSAP